MYSRKLSIFDKKRVEIRIFQENIQPYLKIMNFVNIDSFNERVISQRTIFGSVLVYDFWTHPTPPPINFVDDNLFFSKFNIIYFLLFSQIRLRQFLGRALRPRVRLVKTLSGPSTAARMCQSRSARPRKCTKLIGGGRGGSGGSKNPSLGIYRVRLGKNTFWAERCGHI